MGKISQNLQENARVGIFFLIKFHKTTWKNPAKIKSLKGSPEKQEQRKIPIC